MDNDYEEQFFTGQTSWSRDNYAKYNSEIKTNSIIPEDELAELYKIREKMEDHIKELWDNVIVSYLNDFRYNDILSNLTVNDYHKFYEYMINNNEFFSYVCGRIYDLENFKDSN